MNGGTRKRGGQHGHIILTLGKLTENVKGRKKAVFVPRKKQKQHLPRLYMNTTMPGQSLNLLKSRLLTT